MLHQVPLGGSVLLIWLYGELDLDTTAPLRDAMVQVASRPGDYCRLLLDLSALTYCDNTGLFSLLGSCQALDAAGITVDIIETGSVARAAINRAGLWHRLPLRAP
ncbi:STAS domain-containing protein [Streptomyces sp. NPDC056486]|uniref:STAS domain-containing protein n=1 Tax=Streptomyces sp. NPDC056486 TaxID=3345835 RepID=UPI0036BCCA41